jgi:hypothetical protein
MSEDGAPTPASRARGAAWGLAAALPGAFVFRGFTVDDALITARVASHLASGAGYRFNPSGPEVDAVTPLGYAHLLALFGPASPLGMLERGRALGFGAYLVAAAVLGVLLPAAGRARASALVVLGLSAPLAAWASSGMETGLVTLLAVLALVPGPVGTACAGLAAAWRPELLSWALALTAGRAIAGTRAPLERVRRLGLSLALAVLPAVVVALVRVAWFGSAAPLAMLAKPSDLEHGARYALGGFVLTGAPLLLLAPRSIRRADPETRVLVVAVGAHLAALVLAGGDWMALFRLFVPVLPTALLAGARLAEHAPLGYSTARTALASLASLVLTAYLGWPARDVLAHRRELIRSAEGPLAGAHTVAALDVGWVGAATTATVFDLAGVTDPVVARLPGGHTSKRIPEGLFESRDVDAVVLLLAPGSGAASSPREAPPARAVEARVVAFPMVERMRVAGALRLGGTDQRYIVLVGGR